MKKLDRVGIQNINNDGDIMTIIVYRSYKDIDIQFEDKTIVEHRTYGDFTKGSIKRPNRKLGIQNTNSDGNIMTVIAYRKYKDIDIRFEDGTIVKNRTYGDFKNGLVRNPNHRKQLNNKELHIKKSKSKKRKLMDIIFNESGQAQKHKKLYIRTKANAEIEIPINNRVTLITGSLAVGKTKLMKCMIQLLANKDMIAESTVNIDRIILCTNHKEVEKLIKEKHTNKIIIINKYEKVENIKNLAQYIINTECLFILMGNGSVSRCGYDYSSILGLGNDGVNYCAYQIFNNPSDMLININVLMTIK